MLKKTGIVVASVAAGLIGLSPLAFASEYHHGWDKGHETHGVHESGFSADTTQSNECLLIQDQDSTETITPGLLGAVVPEVGDLLGGDQTQTGNCTNGRDSDDDTSTVLPPAPVL